MISPFRFQKDTVAGRCGQRFDHAPAAITALSQATSPLRRHRAQPASLDPEAGRAGLHDVRAERRRVTRQRGHIGAGIAAWPFSSTRTANL